MMIQDKQTIKTFCNKKVRIISANNFTYITFNVNSFNDNSIIFTDIKGHEVILAMSEIIKMEVLE